MLSRGDRLALLMDADSMNALHEAVWFAPAARLAGWWRRALAHYNVIAPAPEKAFTPSANAPDPSTEPVPARAE